MIKPWLRPVAVTPQVTLNDKVELALNEGVMVSPAPCKALMVRGDGQLAVPVVTAQDTVVQLRPVAAGSFRTVPGAAAGPILATVMV